jgi:hypothetical protein
VLFDGRYISERAFYLKASVFVPREDILTIRSGELATVLYSVLYSEWPSAFRLSCLLVCWRLWHQSYVAPFYYGVFTIAQLVLGTSEGLFFVA